MRDLIVIAIVALCSIIAVRRPVVGMLTFVCFGFLNPQSMTWTIGRTFRHSMFIGLGVLLGYLFWSEEKQIPRQREVGLLVALWIMFGVSTIFAIFPDRALERFIDVSKMILMVVLCTALINTERRLLLLLRTIGLSLGFYAVKGGIFAILSGGQYVVWGPEESFLANSNAIGLALAMNVPLLVYLVKVEEATWFRWLLRGIVCLSYPAVICTYSRGAWVGLAVGTAMIVLRSRRRFVILAVMGITAMVAVPVISELMPQRMVNRYGDLVNYEGEQSAQSRLLAWKLCGQVGIKRPLTGGGFEFHSEDVYLKYVPQSLSAWSERWGVNAKAWSCHSIWFSVIGEHGLLGFGVWVALIGSCFLSIQRLRASFTGGAEVQWILHYADMLQGSLIVFLVVGSFLDAAYFDMFYYLVGTLVIVKERVGRIGTPVGVGAERPDENSLNLEAHGVRT